VIINTLKGLPRTKLDAAWGLTGLVALYSIRIICDRLTKRFPRHGEGWPLSVMELFRVDTGSSAAFLLYQCLAKCIRYPSLDNCGLALYSASKVQVREIPNQNLADGSLGLQTCWPALYRS
jgi:hypothetical protein